MARGDGPPPARHGVNPSLRDTGVFVGSAAPTRAADALDAMHAHPHPVHCQIALQSLGAIGLTGSVARGANLGLQSSFLAAPFRE